jgi:branched-chain amino acid transport system permease protein
MTEAVTTGMPLSKMSLGRELRRVGVFVVAGFAVIALAPLVLDTYSVNILVRSFLYAVAALTVDLLWGYMGYLTFGQSAFFAIGAYAAGLTFTHLGFSGSLALTALGGGLLLAAAVALLVGWLSFARGMSPLYPSVVSLALPVVVTQVLFSGGTFTGSSSGLAGFPTFDLSLEGWFFITGGGLVLLTAAAWMFVRSDAGRQLVAIRENEQRCEYLGIDTNKVKIIMLVVTAVIAALAGYGYAAYTDVIAPELAGFVFGTEIVIWVALGGRGTLIGPVLGAILLDFTSAYLSGSLPFVWKLVIGVAFVGVIILLPKGLIPAFSDLITRLWRGRSGGETVVGSAPIPGIAVVDATKKTAAAAASPSLEIVDVARRYGSLQVLHGINVTARAGELLSLVGPNGAGKTTLMRCISDGTERTHGIVRINGHDIGRRPPNDCVAFGVGRKFQTATVFDSLTVAECLRIARSRLEPPSPWRRAETLTLPHSAVQVIEATGLAPLLGTEVRHLSHGQKQALELAMVLALEPSVLLLDEPTAGLTKPERTLIGNTLVELTRDHGFCVLLVEHDLDFVREISSRIIVLHQGRAVLDGTVQEVVESELVRTIYAGEEHALGEAQR